MFSSVKIFKGAFKEYQPFHFLNSFGECLRCNRVLKVVEFQVEGEKEQTHFKKLKEKLWKIRHIWCDGGLWAYQKVKENPECCYKGTH